MSSNIIKHVIKVNVSEEVKDLSKIKELRLKRGISQEELAKRLGVSRTSVVFWEQGKQEPRANKIKPLAKVLRCKVTDLL